MASIALESLLQPNQACVIPVSALTISAYSFASGDLTSNQRYSPSHQYLVVVVSSLLQTLLEPKRFGFS